MKMIRLFAFLGERFFHSSKIKSASLEAMNDLAASGGELTSKRLNTVNIQQKRRFRRLFSSFLLGLTVCVGSLSAQAAAVQGQHIVNSASFSHAESVIAVISTVSVAFVQRTPAQIEFLQFSTGSGAGVSVSVGQTACQGSNGSFSNISAFQTLDTAVHNLPANHDLVPATAYKLGEPIFVQVTDADQNLDLTALDTVLVDISSMANNDQETLRLTETGVNTGVFVGVIQSIGPPPIHNDCQLSVERNQNITVNYTDQQDFADAVATAVLVDPLGIVFNSSTGAPVDGVTITLWDVTNNQPAAVLGDDGISVYPATLVTGTSTTDSSGQSYVFAPGGFRFPFVSPGNYRFQLTAPLNFNFPTAVSNATLQALTGAPFALGTGSRGGVFSINPGPVINIDVPIDPNPVALFMDKKANKKQIAVGDFLVYTLTVTNPNPGATTDNLVIYDRLPDGFRFKEGSAVLAGTPIAAVISADGRDVSFNAAVPVPVDGNIVLTYVVEVGAKTVIGEAVNRAWGEGLQANVTVQSNLSTATVEVRNELFSDQNILMGRVFVDGLIDEQGDLIENGKGQAGNGLNDRDEEGLPDVRIYLEDGRFVQTDKDGFYHFEGVRPGTHVVQLDTDSLPEEIVVKALNHNRFANRDFSQFVDLAPGSLWRTNFRVFKRAPPAVPIEISQQLTVNQSLSQSLNVVLHITQHERATLDKLNALYRAPQGWTLLKESSFVNGEGVLPQQNDQEWAWPLPVDKRHSEVRFTMQQEGSVGEKAGQALAWFLSYGAQQGSTAIADAVWVDVREKMEMPREFSLQMHFDEVKAALKENDIQQLDRLVDQLQALNIHRLEVVGHTDSQRIKRQWWELFADNASLSKARARAVADYLRMHFQLTDEQVSYQGKGASEPIADNATEAGRASNRRAVIRVFGSEVVITERTDIIKSEGQGTGEVRAEWQDSRLQVDEEAERQARIQGILSPAANQRLPFSVAAVRVQLDSRLKPRLLVDGKEIPAKRIGFKMSNDKVGTTLYSYIGVDFGDAGEHTIRLEGLGPFGNVRFEKESTVIRTGEIKRIIQVADAKNTADGKTRVRIQLELQDEHGQTIHSRAELNIIQGDLRAPVKHDIARLDEANSDTRVEVDSNGWVEFEPVSQSGQYAVTLAYGDVEVDLNTFVSPEYRDMIMIGLAEGTLGYRQVTGNMKTLPNEGDREGWVQDGRIAFYAKGQVKGKWLLTAAYDTAKTKGRVGNRLLQSIQPDRFYTVYGDNTNQRFDAPSARKLYLKLERDTFYALFGDFSTGLSVTELSRYTRTLNGVKSEWYEDQWGYKAFASKTGQTLARDEIQGDGTSGLYRLTRQGLTENSEKIVIETRDRFRSEVILESRSLTRFVDYDIDYQNGSLFFKQPVMSRDSRFNPIVIVVDYETRQSASADLTVLGGRGFVKPIAGVELGLTAVQQEQAIGDDRMTGLDFNVEVNRKTKIKAEVAQTDTAVAGRADAWKVELEHQGGTVNGRAYYRDVESGFGLGQINRSENGTQKYGIDLSAKINEPLSLDGQAYRQKTQSTGAIRDVFEVSGSYKNKKGEVRLGARHAKDELPIETNTSNTLTVGGSLQLTRKVLARMDHEQMLGGGGSIDFPTRTLLGADYLVSPKATIFGEQEWSRGDNLETNISRLGIRGTPWTGAQLASSMESRVSENGERAFANIGLNQTWKINQLWSVDGGIDRTQTLKNNNAASLQVNPEVPLVAGDNDFTALTAGVSYRPEKWEWSARVERRTSSQDGRWGISSGVLGDINRSLSATGKFQGFTTRAATGEKTEVGAVSLGAAWRPEMDGWIVLERFDVKYDRTTGGTLPIKNIRFINNMNANWQANQKMQWAWQYGAKYVRDNVNGKTYQSFLDLIGAELEYDFSSAWDVHVNARRLYSYRSKQSQLQAGLSLGRRFIDNMWGSVGYNFTGFYDEDFSSGDFTAQGPFIKLRMKFDQKTLKQWLTS